MHRNEIICNNYMKRILSETNNPSEIIWNKRSISKHLPSMVTATWMVNGTHTPNGTRRWPYGHKTWSTGTINRSPSIQFIPHGQKSWDTGTKVCSRSIQELKIIILKTESWIEGLKVVLPHYKLKIILPGQKYSNTGDEIILPKPRIKHKDKLLSPAQTVP